MHAVSGAGPNAALGVDAESVEQALLAVGEDSFTAGNRFAVGAHREFANMFRSVFDMRLAGGGDVEVFFVGRESEAVGPHHIGDDRRHFDGAGIDAVNVAAV